MAKYIDKEVLLERMNRTRPYEGENGSFERHRRLQWLADLGQVNMCPASDVSEVVRCRECKRMDLVYHYCLEWDNVVEEDGYCYKGEKK